MAAADILYFRNSKFYWLLGRRGSSRVSMPNFVKIVQSVMKILRFFNFSRWQPLPSWIVEFAKFYWLTTSGGPRRITVPNFVKIGRSVGDIVKFRIFKMAAVAILDFRNRKSLFAIGFQSCETH